MAVKVKSKQEIMGRKIDVSSYLPDGVTLTKEKREKAELLDQSIQKIVANINADYNNLRLKSKMNDFKKWQWLGKELAKAIEVLKAKGLLDQTDIDNRAIWPGFGQYMDGDLSRGFETRRAGSGKDHYRKCWLLATTPHNSWINSWAGWDAFVDRGEQLVSSRRLMPILDERLKGVKINKTEYQNLARGIAEELPSGAGAATISAMLDSDLTGIIYKVCDIVFADNPTYLTTSNQ